MSKVFVLDTNKQPLAPCYEARARQLLSKGKASVYRRFPFTIILKRSIERPDKGHRRLKIDPGSRTTGIAIVNQDTGEIEFAAELKHRGRQIKSALDSRRVIRRSRRHRKARYRKPRFLNRAKPKGWLAPSLISRVYNIETWVNRLRKLCPISAISMELVRFDMQKMQNPEVSGVEYQQGELFGYEVREYLLEKWGRKCAYCSAEETRLEVEHIIPKVRGGNHRVSNLTLACTPCNQKKGSQTAEEFGFPKIEQQAKQPLKDAAAVNATRWKLYERLMATGQPVEVGTGGRTKFNRRQQNLPKTHWLDAACVGESTPSILKTEWGRPLIITATGHGSRQMCRTDRFGFPLTHKARVKHRFGWQTGDLAKAIIPRGKYKGVYRLGRIVAKSGSFLFAPPGVSGPERISINWKYLTPVHRNDGYSYSLAQVCPSF